LRYNATGFSNAGNGVLNVTARVGDTIIIQASGTHPLYFDQGSTTCISGTPSVPVTYTFPSSGTYYFHCGNHASGCSFQTSCGSTNCTAMAGVVVVSP
jgi:hypothetical protein